MYMTDQERLAEARALAITWDKLTRSPKRVTPSAPWIIPAMMVFVTLFAFICLVIKLFMNYLNSKNDKSKELETGSPNIASSTPADQVSMATTATMRTRSSIRRQSRRTRNRAPVITPYQLKEQQQQAQVQGPSSSGVKKISNRIARKALARMAKAEANETKRKDESREDEEDDFNNRSDDNDNNSFPDLSDDNNSDEIQATVNQSGLVYAAAARGAGIDDCGQDNFGSNQPEVHIVQIRDLDDNVQHSQSTWQERESDI